MRYSITSSARANSEGGMAKRLGGAEVDDQLEFDWLLHGKCARTFASQDAIDIGCGAARQIDYIGPVGQEPPGRGTFFPWIDRRKTHIGRQPCDTLAMPISENIRSDDQAAAGLAGELGNSALDLRLIADGILNKFQRKRLGRGCHRGAGTT
jgi:hypothetical protein